MAMEYLIGSEDISRIPLKPFSDDACGFLAEVSKKLMKHPSLRQFPDITAIAFWLRKANLEQMKEAYPEAGCRLGRGLCFHVAPGNIPINFAFTYAFGLLSGCSNIVRLPSKNFGQVDVILSVMNECFPLYPEIEKRTAFVRYPADSDGSEKLSAIADVRMIWGGDRTVSTLKALPTKPKCIDVTFADRYSVCVLSGEAVLKASEAEREKLADNFYNDTYLMDQNACSSPQLIIWTDDAPEGREAFWDSVYRCAKTKYQLEAEVCVDKYIHFCRDAIERPEINAIHHPDNLLYRAELDSLPSDATALRGKGGYFYEIQYSKLGNIPEAVSEKFQTITCFGVDIEKVRKFVVDSNLRGIDRIVPTGKAMDLGLVWDGYDLVRILSRYVYTG